MSNRYQKKWFYHTSKGWMQYNDALQMELDNNASSGATKFDMRIGNTMYEIDFANFKQISKNDPTKTRRIKHEVPENIRNVAQQPTSQSRNSYPPQQNQPQNRQHNLHQPEVSLPVGHLKTQQGVPGGDLVKKVTAVLQHRFDGMDLTLGDFCVYTLVVFLVFMLRHVPVIALVIGALIVLGYHNMD